MSRHGHAPRAGFSPTYYTWTAMIARCCRPGSSGYHKYGGRGISVCDRWRNDFTAFLADMGERPAGCTLDRIDNEGNYEPGNCRWATAREQASNTSRNVYVNIGSETVTVSEAARRNGLDSRLVLRRVARGASIDEAVQPAEYGYSNKSNSRKLTHDGKTMTIAQWSRETGLNYHTIRMRIARGMTTAQVLSTSDHRRSA